jgi:hypothetical protein
MKHLCLQTSNTLYSYVQYKYKIRMIKLNLEIFKYLLNILVIVELCGLRVSITTKEYEKIEGFSTSSFFNKIAPPPS